MSWKWAIKFLAVNPFKPRHQLKSQQMTEGKRHFTLSMTIDKVFLHLHSRTVTQNSLNHRRHFRRGTGFQLRINTGRILLNVPVNHHSPTSIANVPLGHQILVPSTKLLRIAGTSRCPFSPNVRLASLQCGINYLSNSISQLCLVNETPSYIEQISIVFPQ